MHATRADLQGNVDIAGFYNEILGGVSYEYYDLLRTDMIRCKKLKISIYTTLFMVIPANVQRFRRRTAIRRSNRRTTQLMHRTRSI